MEIKNLNSNMINAYKSVTGSKISKNKNDGVTKSGGENVDKIEFDFESAVKAAKFGITAEIGKDIGAERLAALKSSYLGDNSPIDSNDVANEILK